jgi:uncharacterized protein (UPF0332 family)
LRKAERFLGAAERAFDAQDWETAVSRAYYAVYHAAITVLEARGGLRRRRWDHLQLQIDFRERFARRGYLFSIRQADELASMYEARLTADYGWQALSRGRVQIALERAHRFILAVIEVMPGA